MFKLVKGLKELRIKSMLEKGFNKDVIKEALAYLDKKEEELNNDIIPLENDVASLAKDESLTYLLDDETLSFHKDDGTKFGNNIFYSDGKFVNDKYIENKEFLYIIANQYKIVQPKLKELKELNLMRNIVSGKLVFDAYIKEINFDREADPVLRKYNKALRLLSGQIFDNTGLYRFNDHEHIEMFGTKDVDGAIESAIWYVPANGWYPYSRDLKKNEKEQKIIKENEDLLKEYSDLLKEKNDLVLSKEIKYQLTVKMTKLRHKVLNDLSPSLKEERKIIK